MEEEYNELPEELLVREDRVEYKATPQQFPYERLQVYELARRLLVDFYRVAKLLPQEERFELRSQLTRTATSVVLNIIEGSVRFSPRDQARFIEIAYGALHEAFGCLQLGAESDYWPSLTVEAFRPRIAELANKLGALRTYYLSRLPTKPSR